MSPSTPPPALTPELIAAHRLADAADRVSTAHFRSAELRGSTKEDGTPVTVVDMNVEQAMLAVVRAELSADCCLGEEIGDEPTPGATRRWVFDGIDGTHNFGEGRPGWATIIAMEHLPSGGDPDGTDVEQVIGLLSSPALGRRYWAQRGHGAWVAPYRDGVCDVAAATPIHCAPGRSDLDKDRFIAAPFEGALVGWRSAVTRRFIAPGSPRAQCFALDAAGVASGELDGTAIFLGGRWDYAATRVIVEEAGGTFCDVWGGKRLTTSSAVFAVPGLQETVLGLISLDRPHDIDQATLAIRAHRPQATNTELTVLDGDGPLEEWRSFGIRSLPSMSARVHVDNAPSLIMDIVDERAAELERPFEGLTTDGLIQAGLRRRTPAVSTAPITEAALAFLQALAPEQRTRASFAMDADEWRMWINVHMNHFRHGLLIEDLPQSGRDLALAVVAASVSARAFDSARTIMRVNQLIAELGGDHHAFGEWPYFMSIFGTPGGDEPWGWQIDGHHLCLNCVVFPDQVVMTPAFMGSEPRHVTRGPLAGVRLFDPEELLGLDLIRSLDSDQRAQAIIHASILKDDIPLHLQNNFDGRMQAGAFHDNLIAPYQGIQAASMSDAQRRILRSLAATYVGWNAPGHAEVRMSEVEAHLDETWFSWYGGYDDRAPFYYRLHSPVVLIEFDHHPGVVFDNEEPTRNHVHTVVRTPHGGDYGADLLAAHHATHRH